MTNEYINIDNYFQQRLSEEEKKAFENNLLANPEFAEDVAFYVHTKATERENILQVRHNEWKNRTQKKTAIFNITTIGMGIAAILLMVVGFWFFGKKDISQQANAYIEQNLMTLPQKMDATTDSLELGKSLYNEKKYSQASAIFEKLIEKESNAIEYAGLTALQMKEYDIASIYFNKLEANTELLNNKGKFYNAIVELKQGKTQSGERLLKEVIEQNLGGKKEAEEILD